LSGETVKTELEDWSFDVNINEDAAADMAGLSDLSVELSRVMGRLVTSFGGWTRTKAEGSVIRLYLLYGLASGETLRMTDLADLLNVTPRTITTLVDGLEEEGLVRRRPDPTDRRATVVELTCDPEAARQPLRRYRRAVGLLFAGASREDAAAFLRVAELAIYHMAAREPIE
jgi:DNA-binding MarR family transcriptional regulator